MKTDYIHICHARTLQSASEDDKELVILAAATLVVKASINR